MNCFEWQNRSSDYLDGSLSESKKREADDHVESCKDCNERYKHYRLIISSIASQPRTHLPPPLRKAPLSASIPRTDHSKLSFSTWELIPWYLRILLEAMGIVLAVLLVISSAPKVRSLYENNIEKSLNDFKESLTVTEHTAENSDQHIIPPLQPVGAAQPTEHIAGHDDLSGEDDTEEEEDIHVGRSQLWRFTLKTVSPDELRPQVVKTLTDLGVSPNSQGLGGIQVPGGIEFDLVLPQSIVADIKHGLQKLVPHSENNDGISGSENFSWYRVKSKRKIPEGKSQVVIWLSQPH